MRIAQHYIDDLVLRIFHFIPYAILILRSYKHSHTIFMDFSVYFDIVSIIIIIINCMVIFFILWFFNFEII
jgi:hypothetical protein